MTGHVIRVIRIGHKKFFGFNLLSVFAHCQNRIGLSSIGDIVIISQILYIASVKKRHLVSFHQCRSGICSVAVIGLIRQHWNTFKFPVDQILTHRMTPKFQTALRFKGCHLKKCVIYTVFLAETIRIIKPSHRWSHMKRWSPAFWHFFSQFFLYKLLKRSVKCIHLFFSSLSQ